MAETEETQTAAKKPKQKSYFQKDQVNRFVLDDGESFIEHIQLDEGLFQRYQDLTSKIRLDREGDSTEVDMALGKQRRYLLENLVTGWNLVDEEGKPKKFTTQALLSLPPHVITDLVEDIYKKNEILNRGEEDEEGKD